MLVDIYIHKVGTTNSKFSVVFIGCVST